MTGCRQPTVTGQAHSRLLTNPCSGEARRKRDAARAVPNRSRVSRKPAPKKYAANKRCSPDGILWEGCSTCAS